MKLLLDQNLSYKLCAALDDLFPGSSQVRLLGLDRADDMTVWRRAAAGGHVLITHDTDSATSRPSTAPRPRSCSLRCGNQPTAFIERLLRSQALRVFDLAQSADVDLLEIG